MTVEEYLPLLKNGDINPELMSFSRLYLDDIVQRIMDKFHVSPIKEFLEAVEVPDYEIADMEDVEWLVSALFRSKKGFMVLYKYLSINHPSLLDRMMLRNESRISKEVVEAFKQYFLIPAYDMAKQRLVDMAAQMEMDSDDEIAEEEDEKVVTPPPDDEEWQAIPEEEEEDDEYGYVDTVLDKIAAVFDPEFAHTSLVRSYAELKEVTDPLMTPKNAPTMKYSPWARAILRQLPRLPAEKDELPKFPSIVYKFAKACESAPTNRVALLYLLPNYSRKLDEKDAAMRARHDKGGIKLDMVTDVEKECRPPADYAKQRRGPTNQYQTTVMPLNLREYQKELVEKANMGENTVVVAPTGSGKTVVAAQIMRHHVMRRKAEKKPYRMVMVVPKIPLVEQQQKLLYQYMNDVVYSAILHGDMMFEEQGKIDKVLCAELIVMTPQILINMLESVRAKERLFVSDLTLLVLDECHHCCSNHPYAQLMSIVREWKYDKPQIVGLTASLGVGTTKEQSENSALDHVHSLLARMTASALSTVVIHEKELQSHVQLPVDDIKPVEQAKAIGNDIPFTTKLREFMNIITIDIRKDLQQMTHPTNDSGAVLPQSLVKTQVDYEATERYGGRIEAIKQAIRTMNDGAKKSYLNMALDILKVCNMAWALNDLLPSSTVWPMMKVEMNNLRSRNKDNKFIVEFHTNFASKLENFKDTEDDCPMLRMLRAELSSQMKKNPRSKVIIFVGTREMAKALSDYISERKDVLGLGMDRDCDFIISSKARGVGTVSQSPADQKKALAKFRNNSIAVLVSTTVAEEGLDVPECNLIIKYNMTGNVISLTQQRGRARAMDSRSVLIVLSGSVQKRELENANSERMMNHIVRKIHREGEAKLKKSVEMKTTEMRQMEKMEAEMERRKEDSLKLKNFDIVCSQCNTLLCDSYRIKKGGSHYFLCDKDIWDQITVNFDDMKGKYIDMVTTVVGRVMCKGVEGTCNNDLGKVVRYCGCYFPQLRSNALQLKDKTDNRVVGLEGGSSHKKNWSAVEEHFYISKVNDNDVSEMVNALSVHNVELFELLESKCRELQKKSRREAERKYEQKKDETRGAESD